MRLDSDIISLDELEISFDTEEKPEKNDITDGMYKRMIRELEDKDDIPAPDPEPVKIHNESREESHNTAKNSPAENKPAATREPKERNPQREEKPSVREPERRENPQTKKPEREEVPVRKMPVSVMQEVVDENGDATSYLTEDDENDIILKDALTGANIKVKTNPCLIGKKTDCDIIIDDTHISRHHAELRKYGGKVFLRDLGSLNGTFVDGFRLPKETDLEIKSGQELVFSNRKYRIRF